MDGLSQDPNENLEKTYLPIIDEGIVGALCERAPGSKERIPGLSEPNKGDDVAELIPPRFPRN